ncbi:MAG: hypothetical protein JRD89_18120, partial [Deltaproteobacteria bacterium]|nr:hypothetical protein [Deltaproteobacteria bacterium]
MTFDKAVVGGSTIEFTNALLGSGTKLSATLGVERGDESLSDYEATDPTADNPAMWTDGANIYIKVYHSSPVIIEVYYTGAPEEEVTPVGPFIIPPPGKPRVMYLDMDIGSYADDRWVSKTEFAVGELITVRISAVDAETNATVYLSKVSMGYVDP